jgi:3-hydroxybutyryl-CoA dehydratase
MALQVGDTDSVTKTITDDDIRAFADLTGDNNPVHLDDDFAKTTRFGRRIAHGMLSAGLISAVLANKLPGVGTVYLSQSLTFVAPVFPGDTITARVTVTRVREDKPIVTLETVCTNQRDEPVIRGEAVVLS